jgi:uncharacterized membrane protein YfhO
VLPFAPAREQDLPGPVRIRSFRANSIELEADLQRPALVVCSEVFYPGWEAFVDGRPAALLQTDYILRGVAVPSGKHSIVLQFRPQPFLIGLVISAAALVAAAIFVAAAPRRRIRE